MKAALDSLKRSKLGGGGKSALYALPWYVVVGPPAAGKTTALSHSGLGFITPTGASGSKVRGTAGTRNCDWWFSRHAILLDTAGRLATEEDDREEWMTFLDTLRRFRPQRPLDGLVVALSVEDLLTHSEEQSQELVAQLRRAVELDPLSISYRLSLTSGLWFTGDYAGGIAEANKVLELEPDNPGALYRPAPSLPDLWQFAACLGRLPPPRRRGPTT